MKFAFFRSSRFPFYLALAVGLGLTVSSVVAAGILHLTPCPLCIIQRMLYLSMALLALPGWLLAERLLGRILVLLLLASAAATGVFVAGYQTWLQRFAPLAPCGADYPWWEQLVDWAGERVPLLFRVSGVCGDPGWKFLGLSIAEWSLVFFSALLAFFAYSLFKSLSRR